MNSLLFTVGLCVAAASAGSVDSPLSIINFYNSKFFNSITSQFSGFDDVSPFCFGPFCMKSNSFFVEGADWYKSGMGMISKSDINAKQLFQSPVFVMIKSPDNPSKFKMALAIDGLQSIFTDPNFKFIKDFVQTPIEKSALVFPPHHFFNTRLYKSEVDGVHLPHVFNVGQMSKVASSFKHIPFVAFLDKADFEVFHFDSIYDFGKFAVFPDFIEPVVENPVPVIIKHSHH